MTTITKTACPRCSHQATVLPDGKTRCHHCEKRSTLIQDMRAELIERFPSLRGVAEGGHDGQ